MNYGEFREEERKGWTARAQVYDDATARATVQSIPALLSAVRIFPGADLLDAGCGPGYAAAAAAALGAKCIGVDFSPAMISIAKARLPEISFLHGDVEALPLNDQSQDAVVSNIVLFHVTDPGKAIEEAFRVLRPGGYFAFSQWCGPDESDCYRLIFETLSIHADRSLAGPAPNAFDLSDRETSCRLMQNAGFADVTITKVPNILRARRSSFFDFFMDFGVRIPLIMAKQTRDVQRQTKLEMDERAARYRIDGEFRISMPSIVVAGRRPELIDQ